MIIDRICFLYFLGKAYYNCLDSLGVFDWDASIMIVIVMDVSFITISNFVNCRDKQGRNHTFYVIRSF